MTTMTLLHFASPFAFSMPVPVSPTDRRTGGASEPNAASDGSSSSAALSFTPQAVTAEDDPAATSESAGFDMSRYDSVVRRYREQIGDTSDATSEAEAEGSPA